MPAWGHRPCRASVLPTFPSWALRRTSRLSDTLCAPRHERSMRQMERQFIHVSVPTGTELHPEALRPVDDEGSALVGAELVGWLASERQREVSILVLPDDDRRGAMPERAEATLTEGRARAVAGCNAGEDDVLDERLERRRQARDVSFTVGGK